MATDADVDWSIEDDLLFLHVVCCHSSVVDLTKLELRTHIYSSLDMVIRWFCPERKTTANGVVALIRRGCIIDRLGL